MATHDGEQALAERGGRDEREPVRPGEDDLRVRFRELPDQAFPRGCSQQAWSVRVGLMGAGALVALGCLVGILGRLGDGPGVGIVAYVVALACAGPGVEPARRGRTRWALMAIIVSAVGATLGNALP